MTARTVVRALASRQLSVALTSALLLDTLLLAAWSYTSPNQVVRGIAGGIPFLAAYALIAVNLVFCGADFLPRTLRRILRQPRGRVGATHAQVPITPAPATAAIALTLQQLGFRHVEAGPAGEVSGVRHASGPLGTTVFHGGLLLLAAGLLLGAQRRFSGEAIVAEGDRFSGAAAEYVSIDSRGAPPEVGLNVRRIDADYFGDELLFTDLRAEVDVLRDSGAERATVRLSSPWRSLDTWITLTGYAWAPEFAVRDPAGAIVASGIVRLQSFPPGRQDAFDVPGLPHRVHLEVYPDYRADAPASRGPRIRDVRLKATVLRQRVPVASGLLGLGEPLAFDGYSLAFPALHAHGTFRVVRDPGWPLAMAGLALALAGLAWRLARARVEIRVAASADRLDVEVRRDLLPQSADRWAALVVRALGGGA